MEQKVIISDVEYNVQRLLDEGWKVVSVTYQLGVVITQLIMVSFVLF
jgi:hypothetical protein